MNAVVGRKSISAKRRELILEQGSTGIVQIDTGIAFGYTGEIITSVYGPNHWLVPDALVSGQPSPERIFAHTAVTYLGVGEMTSFRKERIALQACMRSLTARQTFVATNTLDLKGQLSYLLRSLALGPMGITNREGLVLEVSRTNLAAMLGCSREMVGRIIRELTVSGVIHCLGGCKSITVLGVYRDPPEPLMPLPLSSMGHAS